MSLAHIYGELSRMAKVGGSSSAGTAWDADALAYLSAIGESDVERKEAFNRFFKTLKSKGIWNRIVAGYFFGVSAAKSKWNFVNPVDSDAAKRATFFGSWNWAAEEAIPNGANTYYDTHINANQDLPQYSFHGSVYPTENIMPVSDYSLYGVRGLSNGIKFQAFGGDKLYIIAGGENEHAINTAALPAVDKLLVASVYHADHMNIYRNGVSVGSYAGEQYGYFPNRDVESPRTLWGAANNANNVAAEFMPARFSFATYGLGLTATMVMDLKNAYNKLRVDLNLSI